MALLAQQRDEGGRDVGAPHGEAELLHQQRVTTAARADLEHARARADAVRRGAPGRRGTESGTVAVRATYAAASRS